MSQYQAISFTYNEQPSASKWNIIGTNFDYMQNSLPPVGAVMYYWGDSAAVPGYYLFANGQTISDSESPINGLTVPDLRSKFIRGVASGNVRTTPVSGGSDTVNLSHTHSGATGSYTLTTSDIPSHNHGISDPGHTHSMGGAPNALYQKNNINFTGSGLNAWSPDVNGSALVPQSSTTGITTTATGGGGGHSHTISSELSSAQSVVPGYQGLVPIIRFK